MILLLTRKLNSRFSMMTMNEILLNRPKVFPMFCVIFSFFSSQLFPVAERFSAEVLSPYGGFQSQNGFLEFAVSSEPSATGNTNSPFFLVIRTSFAISLLGYIADASNLSNSSISAIRIFSSQNPSPGTKHVLERFP